MVANLWKAVDPITAGNRLGGIPINIIQVIVMNSTIDVFLFVTEWYFRC